MNTDDDWIRWGEQDPYFAVITNPKFRAGNIDEAARTEFFESGRRHVRYVLDTCRKLVSPGFAPQRALDFGCGVGRVVLPLAEAVPSVVGIDVSPAMLDEARRNCAARGVLNVDLLPSDDQLSQLHGQFDLLHSFIVFQHIDMPRGRQLFARLLGHLADGGVAAVHVTTAKAYHPDTFGQPPAPVAVAAPVPNGSGGASLRSLLGRARQAVGGAEPAEKADPVMQMNPYNLSELCFMLQTAGVRRFHAEFTDHGGELGVFLFFQKPPAPPKAA
jgi:SAM-dependent methyltransferase